MDRRNFLRTAGGAAAAVAAARAAQASEGDAGAALARPAVGAKARDVRLQMAWPDNDQGFADSARRLTRRIEHVTEQRYRFVFVPGSSGGFDAVTRGGADGYYACEHDNLAHHRALAFFAGLPGTGAMPARTFHNWLTVGEGQALWDDLAGDLGIKALAAAHSGAASGLWAAAPIAGVQDLSGKAIYVPGLARDVVRALGAEAADAAIEDVARLMASGRIFAAEAGGLMASVALRLQESASHHYAPGVLRHGSVAALGLSRRLWDGMPASDRALFEAAAAAEYHESAGWSESYQALMRNACSKRHGIRFGDLARDAEDAIDRVSDAVIAHLAAGDPAARRINASYMAFREAARQDRSPMA